MTLGMHHGHDTCNTDTAIECMFLGNMCKADMQKGDSSAATIRRHDRLGQQYRNRQSLSLSQAREAEDSRHGYLKVVDPRKLFCNCSVYSRKGGSAIAKQANQLPLYTSEERRLLFVYR